MVWILWLWKKRYGNSKMVIAACVVFFYSGVIAMHHVLYVKLLLWHRIQTILWKWKSWLHIVYGNISHFHIICATPFFHIILCITKLPVNNTLYNDDKNRGSWFHLSSERYWKERRCRTRNVSQQKIKKGKYTQREGERVAQAFNLQTTVLLNFE